jgi:hypothetical protein
LLLSKSANPKVGSALQSSLRDLAGDWPQRLASLSLACFASLVTRRDLARR